MKQCIRTFGYVLLASLVSSGFAQFASAQNNGYADSVLQSIKRQSSVRQFSVRAEQNRITNRSVSSSGVLGVNRQSYGNVFSSQRQKPFSALQRGPTVSPYLSLNNSLDGVTDYYNIVRPQREQQGANLAQQRQLNANRQRLNQAAAQGPYDLQGDPNMATTGHTTTYMYMGNFQSTGNFFPQVQGLDKQDPTR